MNDSGRPHLFDKKRLSELAAADVRRPNAIVEGAFLRQGEEGATEILLVRHAQPSPDVGVSLTDLGREQAEVLGSFLAEKEIHAVYSSPTHRTRETAEAIAAHHRLEVMLDDDLRDFQSYVPQGKTLREVLGEASFTAAIERFRQERTFEAYAPYIEDGESLRKRFTLAMDKVIALHPGERVVVVSHGVTIAAYLAALLRSSYDVFLQPRPTAVSMVLAKGDLRCVIIINSYSHFGAT